MLCRLFIDPPAPGSWNMALDETLLESAADRGESSLRFYRWSRPTLSLGYFQPYDDRLRHEPSRNCSAVRRPSGGGAILHDREITYSLAVPPGNRLAAKHLTLYETAHAALIRALAGFAVDAQLSPGRPGNSGEKEPFLCFQRRCAGDVLLSDVKIAGSAQRRRRGAVLQHGSLLLGRSPAAPELAGLAEILGRPIDAGPLVARWLPRLAARLEVDWSPDLLTPTQRRQAESLARERYARADWTGPRGR